MNPTQELHQRGQSLWLDNITRGILDDGTLKRYIEDDAITGLTSNPTIFDQAIGGGSDYDEQIAKLAAQGKSGETAFFELALADLTRAADLFRKVHQQTKGVDGWVSLELSPLLADDTQGSIEAAVRLHAQGGRENLFIKIPGTPAGVPAIEESIFNGVPINVTLLFSREQYLASAGAYMRGIERRIQAGRDPKVGSVASLFVSRWDVAVKDKVPAELKNRLGIAIAQRTYKAYLELLGSPRWTKLEEAGALPQRMLWASTGTKDKNASDTLYVEALAAPNTINTVPEKTLLAFAEHGRIGEMMAEDGGNCEQVISRFRQAGIDDAALAEQLQREGKQSFDKSWSELLKRIADKAAQVSGGRG
ncbi:MAG TPA: transaldolase [Rhodanobacteraceae bacterium]|nr:transaldolase [Rhodanobacteraceae bacterium]